MRSALLLLLFGASLATANVVWRELDEESNIFTRSRDRRETEGLDDWLTDDQKAELGPLMKTDIAAYKKKVSEYYAALSGEERTKWDAIYKKLCAAWVEKVATAEELSELKALTVAKDKDTVVKKITEYKTRLSKEEKDKVELWQDECRDLWKGEFERKRRDSDKVDARVVLEKLKKKLPWLTPDQMKEITTMYEGGKSKEAVQAKIFEYLKKLDPASKTEATKECYKWLEEVASADEIAALHKMHETDHDGCKKKVREYINRLPEGKRAAVNQKLPYCEVVWYGDHSSHAKHDHSSHAHHHKRKRHIHAVEDYIGWLTDEQKAELHKIEDSNPDFDLIINKIKEYFHALPESKQADLKEKFKTDCAEWFNTVASDEQKKEIKGLYDAEKFAELKATLEKMETKLDDKQRHTLEHVREVCYNVWGIKDKAASRMRRDQSHREFSEYLSWLTPEQMHQVQNAEGKYGKYDKVLEFYHAASESTKIVATGKLHEACSHQLMKIVGDEHKDHVKKLLDDPIEEDYAKLRHIIASIKNEGTREIAEETAYVCKRIFTVAMRLRRDHAAYDNEATFSKYFTWLTDEQKAELKTIRESGDKDAAYKKVMQFYEATEGEVKKTATEQLQGACKHHLRHLIGEEKANEVKTLKETGASNEDISKKIGEIIEAIPDEAKRTQAERAASACRQVFGVARKLKRDLAELEEASKKFLPWMTEDQRAEVKSLYKEKDNDAMNKKIWEIYDATSGETKKAATEDLKAGCKFFISKHIGPEKSAQIKALKESGAAFDVYSAKIKDFIGEIEDDYWRKETDKAFEKCKTLFTESRARRHLHRNRRDHHHEHTLKEALDEYLTWLTDEQKAELKTIYEGGDKEGVYKKILEYFDATSGDTKTKATEELKGACKHFLGSAIGPEKSAEVKALKESGASEEAITAKVAEMINGIADEAVKAKALKTLSGCKKVYGVAKRLRRHDHDKDEYKKYMSWLTEDQRAEAKKLHEAGEEEEAAKKVMEFFDAASGDTKKQAAEQLKAACKHYIGRAIGEANTNAIKALKESGADTEAIAAKANEFINAIEDEKTRTKMQKWAGNCKIVYAAASRMRRDHHEGHEHDENEFKQYVTWLTDDQRAEAKKLKEGGDEAAAATKVMEYFAAATGETKKQATEQLKAACKHYIGHAIGKENSEAIKTLKESGADNDAIAAKANEFIDAIADETLKTKMQRWSANCKIVYAAASRMRRDHHEGHEHSTEEFKKYMTWLTEDQRAEVKKLYKEGDEATASKKIMEFFDATSGDTKKQAAEQLKAACKHYIGHAIGEANTNAIKALKESGADTEAIAAKANEFINAIEDEKTRTKMQKWAGNCKIVYAAASRMRRDHHEGHDHEEAKKYMSWLTEDQRAEVKKLHDADDHEGTAKKVLEYFNAATGETKVQAAELTRSACKHYIGKAIGKENTETIRNLKESGADVEAIAAKAKEFIDAIEDEKTRSRIQKWSDTCKAVYAAQKRMRRNEWMTRDQEAEAMKLNEDEETAEKKIKEFFDACQHYNEHLFDEGYSYGVEGEKLKRMAVEANEYINAYADKKLRNKMQKWSAKCKKLYTATSRNRREESFDREEAKKYMAWLTDEQRAEVKKLNDAEDHEGTAKKVLEYFNAATGETKKQAAELTKAACKHYIGKAIGEENSLTIKNLKESGADTEAIAAKANEFIAAIADEKLRSRTQKWAGTCKAVYSAAKRMRRDHHEGHEHDKDEFKKYMTWLTDDQRAEAKKLHEAGDEEGAAKKVMEYFAAASGETKKEATEQLKSACKHYIGHAIGKENSEAIKALKESGADTEAIAAKANEFIDAIADEKTKTKMQKMAANCKIVYAAASRKRRGFDYDEAKKYMGWIDEGSLPLFKLYSTKNDHKTTADRAAQIYKLTKDDTRDRKLATQQILAGCKHYLRKAIGNENSDTLNGLIESGATTATVITKAYLFVFATDEKTQKIANIWSNLCEEAYLESTSKRTKRELNLQDAMDKYFSWLTDEQKAELKNVYETNREATYKKVIEYYDAATGATKDSATVQLKAACKHAVTEAIGQDNMNVVIALKESGATKQQIGDKILEFINAITDETKKAKALRFSAGCKKVYEASKKLRRSHKVPFDSKTLRYFYYGSKTAYPEETMAKLMNILKTGTASEFYKAFVLAYDAKEPRGAKLKLAYHYQGVCRVLLQDQLPDEKPEDTLMRLKLLAIKERRSQDEVFNKLNEYFDKVKDENTKMFRPFCIQVYTEALMPVVEMLVE